MQGACPSLVPYRLAIAYLPAYLLSATRYRFSKHLRRVSETSLSQVVLIFFIESESLTELHYGWCFSTT
jgi:hypothetical protein